MCVKTSPPHCTVDEVEAEAEVIMALEEAECNERCMSTRWDEDDSDASLSEADDDHGVQGSMCGGTTTRRCREEKSTMSKIDQGRRYNFGESS